MGMYRLHCHDWNGSGQSNLVRSEKLGWETIEEVQAMASRPCSSVALKTWQGRHTEGVIRQHFTSPPYCMLLCPVVLGITAWTGAALLFSHFCFQSCPQREGPISHVIVLILGHDSSHHPLPALEWLDGFPVGLLRDDPCPCYPAPLAPSLSRDYRSVLNAFST